MNGFLVAFQSRKRESTRVKLPNFLIIGAAKAGTTSLYYYMKQHPQIFMSKIKEVNYFAYEGPNTKTFLGELAVNDFDITTYEEYIDLFKEVRNESVIGEASPIYLESLVSADRIRKLLPKAKLLVILRNPIEKAFSDYTMAVRNCRQTLGIEEALVEESHHVQVGFYYDKLKRYFDLFPRNQIKVCLYDDLKRDTLSLVQEIYDYLDVDNDFEPDLSHKNVGGFPKNKALNSILVKIGRNNLIKTITPNWLSDIYHVIYNKNLEKKIELPQNIRTNLIYLYEEDILKVQDLIQRDLESWLPPNKRKINKSSLSEEEKEMLKERHRKLGYIK
ncbi:MAG TPA: sulfotransferase [bacterium]|nr:sulfotransferase [bacterium]